MIKELQELFDGLNHLCETNEAFYFSEQKYNEKYTIRSYSYRLASWSDFQVPYAKDCRGTAFILNNETNEWNLFTRAYRKFWNLGEGIAKDEYVSKNLPVKSFEKLDGSLILVGRIDGKLVPKSKTSINSEHAILANKLIQENEKLQHFIKTSLNEGHTPVFELVGPSFKIVLNYPKDELIFLGYVENTTADVVTFDGIGGVDAFKETTGIRPAECYNLTWEELLSTQENSKPDIEGFVVLCDNGEFVKIKTSHYVNLHHLKDNINNLTNLIPLILNDNLDDIIGQFQEDQVTIDYIVQTQEKVAHKFNHLVVEYKNLRGLYFNKFEENRKEFAIEYKNYELFSYVMQGLNTSFREVEQVAESKVKEYILNKCRTLTEAKKFIDNLN